ncbi:putative tricarboxylic transport membrane protein [Tamaricihabitans halophyticus]|uniref:Putative tricarboxylic transport membrane protein n=1 Tax=Tamaricihabitans halophyticus TaxID=1262583 RepID=A0A4V2SUN1_9PSEU|nr:tripartite tricarboxylate transporter permease [Tamaricihabitans halophyticus]TCP55246.1 putative tricarboxylic transport membrane protein [Tamaricihabitans halophyticus]
MDTLDGLLHGLSVAVQPINIGAAFAGVLLGMLTGVLPGLGTVAGAALVLPLTFTLDSPETGIIMIAGIYYGAMYGGSITSILFKVPGEAASVVAAMDGYELARNGRAGPVLGITTIGSFVAGMLTAVVVTFFAPALAELGLAFGPAELFALVTGSLLILATVSGGGLASNLVPLGLGLVVATIGQEPVTSISRFTFGNGELSQGIGLVPVAVGAFGIAELLFLVSGKRGNGTTTKVRVRDLIPSKDEVRRSVAPWLRGTGLGAFLGLLPGPSAAVSAFASYKAEKSISKTPSRFGTGQIEGVSGPEAANNAASTSSIVPILTLGIPFSSTLALVLSAMIIHGVQPGPALITNDPDIFWGVIASIFLGNLMLVVLNIPMIGVWVRLLSTPQHVLVTGIVALSVIGAYSVNNSMLDVYLLVVFAALGYVLRTYGFQMAPLILGVALGPFLETYLRQGLALSRGSVPDLLAGSSISLTVWILVALAVLGAPTVRFLRRRRRGVKESTRV